MEECLEAMLEEERQHQRNMSSTAWSTATGTPDSNAAELCQQLSSLRMQDDLAKQVSKKKSFLLSVKEKTMILSNLVVNNHIIVYTCEFLEHSKSRCS